MEIQVDSVNHREWDTTGWQCFYTHDDIVALTGRLQLATIALERLDFDSEVAMDKVPQTILLANEGDH